MNKSINYLPSLIIFSICFFILNVLGVWQLNKYYLQKIKKTYYLSNQIKDPFFIKKLDYSFKDYDFVTIECILIEKKALFFEPRTYKGKVGYHKLIPCNLKNKYILINKGFSEKKIMYERKNKVVSLQGTILKIPEPGYFSLKNDFKGKKWYTINVKDIAKNLNIDLHPYVIYEKNSDNNDFKNVLPRTISKVNHLQYALTWFLLAVTMIIIFVIFFREKNETR